MINARQFLIYLYLGVFICAMTFSGFSQQRSQKNSAKVQQERYASMMGSFFTEPREKFQQRMSWFDEAKGGMMIHLGLYSQLEGSWKGREIGGNNTEWIWSRLHTEPLLEFSNQEYFDLVAQWNPNEFNASAIVELAQKLGMDYLVITAKHHEGFCLWASAYTDFDIESSAMQKRDLIEELADACRAAGLRFGVSYSILDWHYTLSEAREIGKEWEKIMPSHGLMPLDNDAYTEYIKNQLRELIEYYDVDLVRFEGDWLKKYLTPERSYHLYEYLRELKPEIIIGDKCFLRAYPKTLKKDFGSLPDLRPSAEFVRAQQDSNTKEYYEYLLSSQISWGYDGRRAHTANSNYTTSARMLECYGVTRRVQGNFLLNFGPNKDGSLDPLAVELAEIFAQMARELDELGYSDEHVKSVINANKKELIKARNEVHFRYAHPEAFERLTKARKHERQISQWERWRKQEKELEADLLIKVRDNLASLARESKGSQDPQVIVEQIVLLRERVKFLLND